jgi:hypothetical protein
MPKRIEDHEPDIVWGARAIGEAINRTEHQASYLLERKQLPAKKTGGLWCASRSRLIAHVTGSKEPLDAA